MRILQKMIVWMIVGVAFHFPMVPAAAAPSVTGSTGMIRIPTADALQLGQFSAGYYYWQDHGSAVAAVGLPSGIEVSASAPWKNGASEAWIVNAKYNLNQEALLIPAVSVGIEDIGGQGRRSVYGVISKALPYGFRIHIGAGTGRFDGMFGAIEKVLNPTSIRKKASGFPVTSIIVEMDGAKLNYGARMRLAHGLRLDAGWLGQDEKVYLGLTFTH
ncbi:MAG TPA: YjbH domain-containing protein [Negativicutes bacterium]|nr:YjbH domain-containing protein [Negativicutes bacterium]